MNSAAAAFSDAGTTPPAGGAGDPGAGTTQTIATPAPPPSGATTQTPGAGGAGEQWFSGIQNEETRNWVAAKGFKDATSVAESAFNLEKLIGHDKAGRTLVIPKDDASPEEIKAFHAKLGVPDSADGYQLPVPEGQDPAFSKTAASWMHEAGIAPKAAEKLAGKWNEFMAGQAQAQQAEMAKKADAEFGQVLADWGPKADENLALGKRAAAAYVPGDTPAERQAAIAKIEAAIGTKNMLSMFAKIGGNLGEHKMNDAGGGGGGMTVEAAKLRIGELKGDKAWGQKYVSGDTAAKAEMDRLHKIAYPELG